MRRTTNTVPLWILPSLGGWLTRPEKLSPKASAYEKRRRISVHIDTHPRFVWTGGRPLPVWRGTHGFANTAIRNGLDRGEALRLKIVSQCREPSRRVYDGAA